MSVPLLKKTGRLADDISVERASCIVYQDFLRTNFFKSCWGIYFGLFLNITYIITSSLNLIGIVNYSNILPGILKKEVYSYNSFVCLSLPFPTKLKFESFGAL